MALRPFPRQTIFCAVPWIKADDVMVAFDFILVFVFLDGLNCEPYSFDAVCQQLNREYQKNKNKNEIKRF